MINFPDDLIDKLKAANRRLEDNRALERGIDKRIVAAIREQLGDDRFRYHFDARTDVRGTDAPHKITIIASRANGEHAVQSTFEVPRDQLDWFIESVAEAWKVAVESGEEPSARLSAIGIDADTRALSEAEQRRLQDKRDELRRNMMATVMEYQQREQDSVTTFINRLQDRASSGKGPADAGKTYRRLLKGPSGKNKQR